MSADEVCWNNIPSEILLEIFKNLPFNDKISASSSCKDWRKILFISNVWKQRHVVIDFYKPECFEKIQFLTRSIVSLLRNVTVLYSENNPHKTEFKRFCHELDKSLLLEQLFCQRWGCGKSVTENLTLLTASLLKAIKNSRKLKTLYLNYFIYSLEYEKFNKEFNQHKDLLTHLGIGYCSDLDPENFTKCVKIMPSLDTTNLTNLTVLKIHSGLLNLELLTSLCKYNKTLKRFILEFFTPCENFKGMCQAWDTFQETFPNCEVRLNFIQATTETEIRRILECRSIPVTHVKLLFVKDMDLLYLITLTQCQSIKSIWYVADDVARDWRRFNPTLENPFILCSWRCKKLEDIVLIGCYISQCDVVGISRLRESTLKTFLVPQKNIVDYLNTPMGDMWDHRVLSKEDLTILKKDVSKSLTWSWKPMSDSIYEQFNTEEKKNVYLHNLLAKDLTDELQN